jgi:hypothetical protein
VANTSEDDQKWYFSLVDSLVDKDVKLKNPHIKRRQHHQQQHVGQNPYQRNKALHSQADQAASQPKSSQHHERTDSCSNEATKVVYEKPQLEPLAKETPKTSSMASQPVYEPKSPVLNEENAVFTNKPPAKNENSSLSPSRVNVMQKSASIEAVNDSAKKATRTEVTMVNYPAPPPAVQNQPQPQQQNSVKPFMDSRVYNLMKNWYPLRFKLNYPRKSRLNADEQKEFIEFHAKFRHRTKLTAAEVKFFKKYIVGANFFSNFPNLIAWNF